jgi:hypothetical protein
MARAKKTPGDELAGVDARLDALGKEREDLSARQGDAEALIRSFPERHETALTLTKLGEEVEVPDEAEQARLQRFVATATAECDAIGRARRQIEEERTRIIAAGLPYFDAEAEASARAYEALGEALLVAVADFQAGGQAKGAAWGHSRTGRKELGRDLPPGVSFHDLGHLQSEITDAIRCAWPANSEKAWREFRARESGGAGEVSREAPRLSNAEAVARFGGEAA